jgi:hypothetical protein
MLATYPRLLGSFIVSGRIDLGTGNHEVLEQEVKRSRHMYRKVPFSRLLYSSDISDIPLNAHD